MNWLSPFSEGSERREDRLIGDMTGSDDSDKEGRGSCPEADTGASWSCVAGGVELRLREQEGMFERATTRFPFTTRRIRGCSHLR